MSFRQYASASEFSDIALSELQRHMGLNNLMIGVLGQMLTAESPLNLLFSFDAEAETPLWAIQSPNHYLILSFAPRPAVVGLAKCLSETDIVLPGVVGPYETAEWFAAEWARLKTTKKKLSMTQKIMELKNEPKAMTANGEMRLASESHTDLLTDWLLEFFNEALPAEKPSVQVAKRMIEYRINRKELYVWIDQNNCCSMTMGTKPFLELSRVSFVYTPKLKRKQFYASALVSSVSQALLEEGAKSCCLYTDASNPTSNHIYLSIGYEVVGDSKHYLFLSGSISKK